MRTSARSVAVLLFDEVELLDVAGPLQVLTLAGRQWNFRPFRVHAVARKAGSVETRNQLSITASEPLEACRNAELVLVPGGYGARRALEDDALIGWLRERAESAELVLAVGYGTLLLARAGLLAEIEVAAAGDAPELITSIEPLVKIASGRRAVSSGKFFTAAGSAAGIDLGLAAVARLLGAKLALGLAEKLGYEWTNDTGAPERVLVEILRPIKD